MEQTLILVKPDGVQRGLAGEIIGRFERRGLKMVGMKFMQMSRELAETHYGVHKERPFYESLVSYIVSGPIVAMVWEGNDAICRCSLHDRSNKSGCGCPGYHPWRSRNGSWPKPGSWF